MTCLETLPPAPLAESCIAVLETKRLVLRAPQLVDAKAIAALANDRRAAAVDCQSVPNRPRVAARLASAGGAHAQQPARDAGRVRRFSVTRIQISTRLSRATVRFQCAASSRSW